MIINRYSPVELTLTRVRRTNFTKEVIDMTRELLSDEEAQGNPVAFFGALIQSGKAPKSLISRLIEKKVLTEDPEVAWVDLQKKPPIYRQYRTLIGTSVTLMMALFGGAIIVFSVDQLVHSISEGWTKFAIIILTVLIELLTSTSVMFWATIKLTELSNGFDSQRSEKKKLVHQATEALLRIAYGLQVPICELHLIGESDLKQLINGQLRKLAFQTISSQRELRESDREDPGAIIVLARRAIAYKEELREAHQFFASLDLADKEWDSYWPKTEKPARRGPSLPGPDSVFMKPE